MNPSQDAVSAERKHVARQMTAALKRELVPALLGRGFTGAYPRYRRETATTIEFVAIFYDKPGTRFFLEFGAHARGDKQTSWGEVVPEAKLTLEHVALDRRARLQVRGGRGSTSEDWFDCRFDAEAQCQALAAQVAALLPQVEAWLERDELGPNVSPV